MLGLGLRRWRVPLAVAPEGEALRKARGSELLASASASASAPPSRKAGHVGALSGVAARITVRRILSWSFGASRPPGGTSRFPLTLRRSTAPKGRFLIPLVVPEQAGLNHPYTSTTRGRASSLRGSEPCPSPGPRAGPPLPLAPAPPAAPVPAAPAPRPAPPAAEAAGVRVDVVEVGVVVVVVVGVVRRHLLDAGGDAPQRLHVQLWGRPAPRPPPFAPPSSHGSHAPSCLSLRAHGALALALWSLPGPHAFVPLSALWVLPPVTCALPCWSPFPSRSRVPALSCAHAR